MNDEPTLTNAHTPYEEVASIRRDSPQSRKGYSEAGHASRIGLAIRERRIALNLSQAELAAKARMTQPALSRPEAGGVVPTTPLLERISVALGDDGAGPLATI